MARLTMDLRGWGRPQSQPAWVSPPTLPAEDHKNVERIKALPINYPQSGAGGCLGYQLEFRFPEDVPLLQEHLRRGWSVVHEGIVMQALMALNEKLDRLLAA